jgi:hypothetical protein
MRRPPSRTQGILPVVRQLNSVRRLTGNRASNCFSSMKLASPAGAWFCSAWTPAFCISGLAGGAMLEESFHSLFTRRRLYANHGKPGMYHIHILLHCSVHQRPARIARLHGGRPQGPRSSGNNAAPPKNQIIQPEPEEMAEVEEEH